MEAKIKKLSGEIEKSLLKKLENSIKLIKKEEIIEALNNLKVVEGELEALVTDGIALEHELVITFLHNIAFCYQQLGELEEAASYIEASIFNAEKRYLLAKNKSKSKNDGYYSSRIKQCSYLSSMYSSLCVSMSCIDNHFIAMVHAKKSIEYAATAIKCTLKAAAKNSINTISAQKIRKKIYLGDPKTNKRSKDKLHSNLGILASCLKMLSRQELAVGLLKLNTVDGFKQEFKETYTLDSAMKLKNINYYKLKTLTNLDFELENDEVFRKIYNVIIPLYLISTEAALLDEKEQAIRNRNKAVTIARTFLPNDCVLISQIQYLDE